MKTCGYHRGMSCYEAHLDDQMKINALKERLNRSLDYKNKWNADIKALYEYTKNELFKTLSLLATERDAFGKREMELMQKCRKYEKIIQEAINLIGGPVTDYEPSFANKERAELIQKGCKILMKGITAV